MQGNDLEIKNINISITLNRLFAEFNKHLNFTFNLDYHLLKLNFGGGGCLTQQLRFKLIFKFK